MAILLPQDDENMAKERKSFQILFSKFNAEHWDFNGRDNSDHGMDYEFEYIEDGEYRGFRMLTQVKSSESENVMKYYDKFLSFKCLPVKTASYAITCSNPFVLFVVDLRTNIVYYLALQDYFISNPDLIKKLSKNKKYITVHIPLSNVLSPEKSDEHLIRIAKSSYCFVFPDRLTKVR